MNDRPENEIIVEKTITTDLMASGGRLNPVQQDAFVQLVKDNSVLLRLVRFVQMPTSRKQIDKIYIGEPVTRAASENGTESTDSRTVFDQIDLVADKVKSDWSITTETLQENIEGEAFEDTVMSMMTKRISTDLELLAVQGDTTVTPGTPLTNLLITSDGWDKITESAQIVDAAGATIEKAIFAEALRKMPEQYLQDPDLRWIVSRPIATDWSEEISDRETDAGDKALAGSTLSPFGIPMLTVPAMPSRKALAASSATPGRILSDQFGPYEFVAGVNDGVDITVNGGSGAKTGVIPAGVYTVVELIPQLRTLLAADSGLVNMFDDGEGRLVMETTATGTAETIIIAAEANDAYDELGWTIGTYAGADSGGDTFDGTIMFLANLKNFIFGMVDDTRIYQEFNKDRDRHEFVVYNQLEAQVENLEAIVKVVNIKRGT